MYEHLAHNAFHGLIKNGIEQVATGPVPHSNFHFPSEPSALWSIQVTPSERTDRGAGRLGSLGSSSSHHRHSHTGVSIKHSSSCGSAIHADGHRSVRWHSLDSAVHKWLNNNRCKWHEKQYYTHLFQFHKNYNLCVYYYSP